MNSPLCEKSPAGLGILLGGPVVIPRDEKLVRVRESAEPSGKIRHFIPSTVTAEVATMNEHVPVGNRMDHPPMTAVGVAQNDELERIGRCRIGKSRCHGRECIGPKEDGKGKTAEWTTAF